MPLSRSRDYLSIGEVLEAVRGRLPRHQHLQDPLPRDRGPHQPRADQLRLPEVLRAGRRPAPLHPAAPAGPLPAAQGHQGPPQVRDDPIEPAPHRSPAAAPTATARQGDRRSSGPAPRTSPASRWTGRSCARPSGLAEQELASLEDFGILTGHDGVYDENDLLVAQAAKGFFAHGVEARHLRMYKQAVDRETAFIEQIIIPVAHRKDPDATQASGGDRVTSSPTCRARCARRCCARASRACSELHVSYR